MAGDDANSVIKHWEYLWSAQGNFRQLWNVVANYVMPDWANFVGEFAEGVNRNTRLFDQTAITANERFAAAMEQMLTPRTQVWHKLQPWFDELEDDQDSNEYLDQLVKIVFGARYRPFANFASQTDECYMSLGAFGNNALFTDEVVGKGLRYRSIPLNEIVWSLDHSGMVDTVFRKFKYTAKQAMQQFGAKAGDEVKKQYEKNPYTDMEFLHCVRPNGEMKPGRLGYGGMRYESWYLSLKDKAVIDRSGYRTFPYAIGRYRMAPREHYGRSPAVAALPAIRSLNEMKKTMLRAGQKMVDPPILLSDEGVLTPFNQRPGATNYGMINADGQALAQPFNINANLEFGKEMMAMEAQAINDSFLTSLFQILVQNPQMTATEALIRAQEKGAMIAPAMGRQQSEFLGPLIARELDILEAAGQLPPLPESMIEAAVNRGIERPTAKDVIKIEYTSPLTRAMRAEEGTAIMNTVQSLGIMAQLDPSVLKLVDFTDAAREMALINGMPAKLLRTDEQIDELLNQQAQQAQDQQMVDGAQPISASALNLAKAQQAMAQAGQANAGTQ